MQGPHGDESLDEIVLLDTVPAEGFSDRRLSAVAGDITDARVLREVVDGDVTSVFHLAAIVSGQAEADARIWRTARASVMKAMMRI